MKIQVKRYCFLFLVVFISILSFPFSLSAQTTSIEIDSTVVVVGDTLLDPDDVVVEEVVLDTLVKEVVLDSLLVVVSPSKDELEDIAIEKKMKELYKEVPLVYNKKVKGFINYFTVRNRTYLPIMERRKNLYFPIFEAALKKHGMPDEIKYLSIVESGLNPMAISRAGAAGPWQFMPATGREMGLIVNDYIDERLDPIKSTDAACRYLKRLYKIFGDWELALASYNCGPGVVRRAVRQSGGNSFWKIYDYLPSETRSYVPQYAAVVYVMNNMGDYGLVGDSIQYPMETDTILLTQLVNLHVLCDKLDLCYEDFVMLNPAIRTNILPANLNYPIRLPREKKIEFLINQHEIKECVKIAITPIEVITNDRRKSSSGGGSVSYRQKITHTVKNGEVLGKIAGKYGTTVSQIKSWNNLRSNTIRVGQKIVIYKVKYTNKTSGSSVSTSTRSSIKPSNVTPKYYYVKPGDTLWTISKKFDGLTIEKIKKLNNMSGNTIKVGQKLLLS